MWEVHDDMLDSFVDAYDNLIDAIATCDRLARQTETPYSVVLTAYSNDGEG